MKRPLPRLRIGWLLLPLMLLRSLHAQSAAFTYQGRLLEGGQPANGTYEFQFTLTDGLGIHVSTPVTTGPVVVTDGLFLVGLDFGAAPFDGSLRWLEIGVGTNGSTGAYVGLSPRQPLRATPYATFASTAANAAVAGSLVLGAGVTFNGATITNLSASQLTGTFTLPVASDLSGSSNYNANRLVGTIPLANLPTEVLSNPGLTSSIPVSAMQPLGSFSLASVAPTPPMGICTWPSYSGANQSVVEMLCDLLYTNGLVGYGWKVIQLDAGWQLPDRDAHENLLPNPITYPDWPGTLSYMRNRGIALGLYTEMTSCGGGVPTTYGYFAQDAAQFAAWGAGYLKVDYCDNTGNGDQRYAALSDFRRAMDAAGLSAYVVCGGWGTITDGRIRAWVPAVVNSWRLGMDGDAYLMGGPISAQYNMLLHFHHALQYGAAFTGPGHYPDMDFIHTSEATSSEYLNTNTVPARYPTIESAIGLAAMVPSPIMLDQILLPLMPMYTNTAMIAIDQDPLVCPAQVVSSNSTSEVWARRLFNGDRAVALINKTSSKQTVSVSLNALGLPAGPSAVYSVWDHAYLPCAAPAFTSSVDPACVQLLRFSPVQPGLFTGTVGLTSNSVPFTLHITNGLIYGVTSP
jgi:alpha-galactosidase